jgi:guanylate kinase
MVIRVAGLFGPSGAGKTTLARLLPELWPDRYRQALTVSTRASRADDAGSYHSVSEDTFLRLREAREFLAETEIRSSTERRLYAYRRSDVVAAAEGGRIVVLPVERRLMEQLRAHHAVLDVRVIGLMPPGGTREEKMAVLAGRLTPRYIRSPVDLDDRLRNARDEDLPILEGVLQVPGVLLDTLVETAGPAEETARRLDTILRRMFALPG